MIAAADAISLPLPGLSVDLVLGSPPYMDARTYGIDAQRGCVEWVEWMLEVTTEALRVARNCVVWVVGGVTRGRNYWPGPEGLAWEWYRRGGHAYRPCIFHRVGIPGSGGDDWFRSDTEYCLCFKRPGALPWSDNTACGHPPKWGPGGEMSHRLSSGQRVNQWGPVGGPSGMGCKDEDGKRTPRGRPSHGTAFGNRPSFGGTCPDVTKRSKKSYFEGVRSVNADGIVIANPGNVIKCKVGGNQLGHPIAYENEAPFPEKLAEFFVLSLCPPGGTVLDPFSGSGTTAAVAQRHGRKFVALDIRESECDKTRRRLNMNQLALIS